MLPLNPNDGDQSTVGDKTFAYSAAVGAWNRITVAPTRAIPTQFYGTTAPTGTIIDGDIWVKDVKDVQVRVNGAWVDWPKPIGDLPDEVSRLGRGLPVFPSLAQRLADLESMVYGFHGATNPRIGINYNTLPNEHNYMDFRNQADATIGAFVNGTDAANAMILIRSNIKLNGGVNTHIDHNGEMYYWNRLTTGVITAASLSGGNQMMEKGVPDSTQSIAFVIQKVQAYGNASNTTEAQLFGNYRYVYVLPFSPTSYVTGSGNGYWAVMSRKGEPTETIKMYID